MSELKRDLSTRHIPVQVLASEADRAHALALGAFACIGRSPGKNAFAGAVRKLAEVARRPERRILVVDRAGRLRDRVMEAVAGEKIDVSVADTGPRALRALGNETFDCLVLAGAADDPAITGLLEDRKFQADFRDLPVLLFPDPQVTNAQLPYNGYGRVRVREAGSPQQLCRDLSLCLHLKVDDLAPEKQESLRGVCERDDDLAGKKVLIVDDDRRNIFAISSVLQRHDMQVISASTGRGAIDVIEQTPELGLVLLDIMMPEMDGYETIRRVRQRDEFRQLPIVALTAKAMKGDREKCLEAGASDYIAKPVDTSRLLSVLRAWLPG